MDEDNLPAGTACAPTTTDAGAFPATDLDVPATTDLGAPTTTADLGAPSPIDADAPSATNVGVRASTPLPEPSTVESIRSQAESTPSSYRVNSANPKKLEVADVSPYLLNDMKRLTTCNIVDMIKECLRRCGADADDGATLDDAALKAEDAMLDVLLQRCLKEVLPYCQQPPPPSDKENPAYKNVRYIRSELTHYCNTHPESDRYKHIASAFNRILEITHDIDVEGIHEPSESKTIMFHVNDKDISANHDGRTTIRKPDMNILLQEAAAMCDGDVTLSWRELAEERAREKPKQTMNWAWPLSNLELKLERKTIRRQLKDHYDATLSAKDLPAVSLPEEIDDETQYPNVTDMKQVAGDLSIDKDTHDQFTIDSMNVLAVSGTANSTVTTPSVVGSRQPSGSGPNETLPSGSGAVVSDQPSSGRPRRNGVTYPTTLPKRKSPPAGDANNEPAKRLKSNTGTSSRANVNATTGGNASGTQKTATEKDCHLAVQIAMYATEILSVDPTRTHTFNFTLIDSVLHIWYFDRENVVQSTGLDIIADLPYLMVLLFALQRFRLKDWGRSDIVSKAPLETNSGGKPVRLTNKQVLEKLDPQFCFHRDGRRAEPSEVIASQTGGWIEFNGGWVKVDTQVPLFSSYGLFGRNTSVLAVEAVLWKDGAEKSDAYAPLTVKLQWGEASRDTEATQIERAHTIGQDNPFVQGHIPKVYGAKELLELTTATIRKRLKASRRDGKQKETGSRTFRMMFLPRYFPITTVCDAGEFLRVFYDCFHCHFHLWQGGLHHRDISVNNLMFFRDRKKKAWGVLIDFDLASYNNSDGHGHERTGTMPFMALELLTDDGWHGKLPHLYVHDAESFYWIAHWITTSYEGYGVIAYPGGLRDQLRGVDYTECRARKVRLFSGERIRTTGTYTGVVAWILKFRKLFRDREERSLQRGTVGTSLFLPRNEDHPIRAPLDDEPASASSEESSSDPSSTSSRNSVYEPGEVALELDDELPLEEEQYRFIRIRNSDPTDLNSSRKTSDDDYARNEQTYRHLIEIHPSVLKDVKKGIRTMKKKFVDV